MPLLAQVKGYQRQALKLPYAGTADGSESLSQARDCEYCLEAGSRLGLFQPLTGNI